MNSVCLAGKDFFWHKSGSEKICPLKGRYANLEPRARKKASLMRSESGVPMKNQVQKNEGETVNAAKAMNEARNSSAIYG